jgi:LPXTG-motif cell wall-anchored protein
MESRGLAVQEDEFIMVRIKLVAACALAIVVSLAGTSAAAQEPTNQITYFTFSAPFELPGGKTLPAGKYVFKIVDTPSNRHIVQVMSEDQKQMHATLMAVPAERQDPADEPEVRFMEAAANTAPAIRTWWYPGRSIGHEFIYPKDHARRLAARQSEGVLTVSDDAAGEDQLRTAKLARIGKDGREAAVNAEARSETTRARAETTPAPATSAARTEEVTPRTTADTTAARRENARPRKELPQTASPLPLFALLGLGSLAGAGALRLRR